MTNGPEQLRYLEAEDSGVKIIAMSRVKFQNILGRVENDSTNFNPIALHLLFGGDRIAACDEAVVAQKGEETIGFASIAPRGEERSGQPTIVGLLVSRNFRNQGYGTRVLKATIERCIERGFKNIRIDAMSPYVLRMIDKLPIELRRKLDVHDLGDVMQGF